jgi:hypothetical protein
MTKPTISWAKLNRIFSCVVSVTWLSPLEELLAEAPQDHVRRQSRAPPVPVDLEHAEESSRDDRRRTARRAPGRDSLRLYSFRSSYGNLRHG